jgi:hypothetical protein
MVVDKENVNHALEAIESNALPNTHADSCVHWVGWKPNAEHILIDVIRLTNTPSWGYLECTTAGTTGSSEPECPFNPGDTVTDGSVVWTLKRIGMGKITATGVLIDDTQLKLGATNVQSALEKIKEIADKPDSFEDLENVPQDLKDLSDVDGKLAYKGTVVSEPVQRVVGFVGADVDINFPWTGKVSKIQIALFSKRTTDCQFGIYYQKKTDFSAGLSNWQLIGGQVYTIAAGNVFFEADVNLDIIESVDFRSYVIGDDSDLTIQLIIK